MAPRIAAAVALLILPALTATLVWVHLRHEPLWPWSTVVAAVPSGPQYLLRYLVLLAGGLVYVVASSVRAWVRLARIARTDLEQAGHEAQTERWDRVALHVHRHGLLCGELGRRPDPAAEELDRAARPHVPGARRLYVYYPGAPPPLPEAPHAGFQPQVVPLSIAGGWWTGVIVAVLAVGALAELRDALVTGHWRPLQDIRFVVVAMVLAGYAYVHAAGFFGRRDYFRFAPGTAELMQFKVRTQKTRTETILLRDGDIFLDLTRPVARLAFVERSTGRWLAEYHFGRDPQTIETCLRAVLSEAPIHALPERELTA
ncbi:MAG: hypothetical protein V2A79_07440 [Planctomycetota bacterium]